jgi:guanine deaminase
MYSDKLIVPGFIDTHIHYVQTDIIGAFGKQLIDWLNTYTFIAEQKFKDKSEGDRIAEVFCDQLLRNGTTTALTFCAVYPESVDALFEAASRRNMRMIAGKIMMDRNAPDALLDTAGESYEQTKTLIENWHGRGRNLYAITPRFAPTSTPEQLEAAGRLWKQYPGTYVHSHLSENEGEIAWVKELFPDRKGYLDVYDHYGLTGERAVYAHGVHLTEDEMQVCHDTGTAISHCPTSNLFLGSGLFPLQSAKDAKRPMKVGLGTDIGAGTSFSLLQTMNEAYKVSQLREFPLDATHAFYLATLGNAEALHLDDKLGTLDVGKEADFVVLNSRATALLDERMDHVKDIEEELFVLMTLGDDRCVEATYVAGKLAYQKEE